MMAAAQKRGRECHQMHGLAVIMAVHEPPLPRNTIHKVACAPFQAIPLGRALPLAFSSTCGTST